ncbi:MAG: transcriptional regulator [Longispora sp.]|nr:transcriptional regulator [Longispora sp. (in: high G+C Gram-positive bacteria)]
MVGTDTSTTTEKGRRIIGAERQNLAKDLVERYTAGESIRALASSTGRSYGFVHRVLSESEIQLRQRGGARRRKKA